MGARDAGHVALADGQGLRHGEADGGGAGDALRDAVLQHVQSGGGGRKLDRNIRRPGMKPAGHGQHAIAVAGAQRIYLRANKAVAPGGGFENGQEFGRRPGYGNAHQGFRFGFRRQLARQHGVNFFGPNRPVADQRQVGKERIGGDADGAALQPEIQFGSFGRIVPPLGGSILDDPTEIRLARHGLTPGQQFIFTAGTPGRTEENPMQTQRRREISEHTQNSLFSLCASASLRQ